MIKLLTSSFAGPFAGGFIIGAAGLFALHAHHAPVATSAPAAIAANAVAAQAR